MYLVELRPGKEELYRTVDELAAAIRSGDVDAHSRIFHRATSKWISITLHPQFKAIAAAREEASAEPRKPWTFLNSASDELDSEPAAHSEASAPEAADIPGATDAPEAPMPAEQDSAPGAAPNSGPWRRPLALGLAGLMAILGAQLGSSIARGRWVGLEAFLPSSAVSLARQGLRNKEVSVVVAKNTLSKSSTISLAGMAGAELTPTGSPISGNESPVRLVRDAAAVPTSAPPTPVALRRPASVRIAAPAKADQPVTTAPDAEALMVDSLIHQYEAAYDEARDRLTADLQAAEFRELFAPVRLASTAGVERARLGVVGARRAVQAYRQRAEEIERTYQDSFAVRSRALDLAPRQVLRWYARPRRSEPAAVQALSGALLTTADSVFAVLTANAGTYTVANGSIEFSQAEAAAEYGRLRQRFERQLDSARVVQAQGSPGVVAVLLEMGQIGGAPAEVSAR